MAKVIVIGGGPAGIMAAITAAKNNEVIFEGIGEIDIKSNGWNGNAIQIEMYIDEGDE